MVGHGEPMDAALRQAFDRHGLFVEESGAADARLAVRMTEPNLVLLVGDAARDAGRAVLDALCRDPSTKAIPVALLAEDEGTLDQRVLAFRYGAVAAVPRTASADEIARRVAKLARELSERADATTAQLGEATLDELVSLVTRELRSGILRVGRQGDAPTRIVLGAGRPVADAVQEFVQRMRPLVTSAEPLVYEFHAGDPGGMGLVIDGANSSEVSIYHGLRILLVDHDPSRADALAQELRARGATVAISDTSGRGLERARGLDPEVVLMDSASSDSSKSDLVRLLKEDIRLQWAAVLVTPWEELWTDPNVPDAERLRDKVAALVTNDRRLRERVQGEEPFEVTLETTGPCRLLRALAETKGPHHVLVRGSGVSIDMDLAEGLLVGVVGQRTEGGAIEGVLALSALLRMENGSVRIERRANPSIANVMMPVEEALARAVRELSSEATTAKSSRDVSSAVSSASALKRMPFPPAHELGRTRGTLAEGGTQNAERGSGLPRSQPGPRAHGAAADLRWSLGAQTLPMTSVPSIPPNKLPDRVPPPPMGSKSAAGWPSPRNLPRSAQHNERRATIEIAPRVPAPAETPNRPAIPVSPLGRVMPKRTLAGMAAPPVASKAVPPVDHETLLDLEIESIHGENPTLDLGLEKDEIPGKVEKNDDAVAWTPAGLGGVPMADKPVATPVLQSERPPKPVQVAMSDTRPTPTPVLIRDSKKFDFVRAFGFVMVFVASSTVLAMIAFIAYQRFWVNEANIEWSSEPATEAVEVAPPLDEEERGEPAIDPQATDTTEVEANELVPETQMVEPEPSEPDVSDPEPSDPEPSDPESSDPDVAETASSESETEVIPVAPSDETSVDDLLSRARQSPPLVAETLYRRVLSLEPNNHYAMIGLAELLLQRGDAAAALPWVEDAVRRRSRRAAYRVLLGDVRQALGDQAGANEAWQVALELEPSNRHALRRLRR